MIALRARKGKFRSFAWHQNRACGAGDASSLGTRMARAMSSALGEQALLLSQVLPAASCCSTSCRLETGRCGLAGGIDITYPAENGALFIQMETKVLITEQPITATPCPPLSCTKSAYFRDKQSACRN